MVPNRRKLAPFQPWSTGSVDIPGGDFFALTPELRGPVERFYDRASLVALAPPMRRNYWARLAELLAPGARILLLSWEYPQAEIDRPPFALIEADVQALFGRAFRTRLPHTPGALENNPKLAERSLGRLQEKAHVLRRR